MTNYVDTLSAADKDIYLKGLGSFPDPFSLKDGWTNDPKQWPPISYLDIVTYFVLSTNLYSLQQTKAFRSLEAYLYATEGHVQEVHHVQKDKLTLLLADVLPSQRQGKKTTMYKAFLIVDADGQIKTAHCTCMAGNGKACSHAAAIAFKVEFAVRLGLSKTTPTDELCKWNGTAKKQVQPSRLQNMDFSNPKKKGKVVKRKREPRSSTPNPQLQDLKKITVSDVASVCPKAAILKAVYKEQKMFTNIIEAVQEAKDLTFVEALSHKMTENFISQVERGTRGQSASSLWADQRLGRITSSVAYRVIHCKDSEKLVDIVCDSKTLKNIPAIKHGIDSEERARSEYALVMSAQHEGFVVNESGLCLNKKYPFLGASPDGITFCNCCGKGTLEIKCPYKYKDKLPTATDPDDPNFPILYDRKTGNCTMTKTHSYYTQVQMHMLMTDTNFCDFYMYASENSICTRVARDHEFINEMVNTCTSLYMDFIAPKLVEYYSS